MDEHTKRFRLTIHNADLTLSEVIELNSKPHEFVNNRENFEHRLPSLTMSDAIPFNRHHRVVERRLRAIGLRVIRRSIGERWIRFVVLA